MIVISIVISVYFFAQDDVKSRCGRIFRVFAKKGRGRMSALLSRSVPKREHIKRHQRVVVSSRILSILSTYKFKPAVFYNNFKIISAFFANFAELVDFFS